MTGKEMKNHNCDNINCNHNDTKGLCCLFNPDNCKYRQLQKENAELKAKNKWYSEQVCNKECAEVWGQLTKVKDALRMIIDSYNHKERFSFEKDLIKAEQFISEGKKGMTENSNVPECPSIKIGCDKMYYVDEVEK